MTVLVFLSASLGGCGGSATSAEVVTTETEKALERARQEMRQGRYEQALAVLTPLPLQARHDEEREHLALAATVLLHLENPFGAETLLKKALEGLGPRQDPPSWLGGALANLGKAFLSNGRIEKAVEAYRRAVVAFSASGHIEAAAECQKTVEAIQREWHRE